MAKQKPGNTPPDEGAPKTSHVEVSSIMSTSPEDVAKMRAQIDDLQHQLKVAQDARTEAEQAALAAAESQGAFLMQGENREIPTGKFVEISVCSGYEVKGYKDDGREILKPVFKRQKVPTFFYKINMPPVGGLDMKTNGQALYHGTVYTFDIHTLRDVKEREYRLWDHDRNIHGSDENFYRTPMERRLSPRG